MNIRYTDSWAHGFIFIIIFFPKQEVGLYIIVIFVFTSRQETVKAAPLFTNRFDHVDEQFSVHSVTKTELINIPLHKLRHKICDKIQWSSKPHTCCSFELLDFSTTAPVEL